jgi:hypothetical protein
VVTSPPEVSAIRLDVMSDDSRSALLRAYANIAHDNGDSGGGVGPGVDDDAKPRAPIRLDNKPVTASGTGDFGAGG